MDGSFSLIEDVLYFLFYFFPDWVSAFINVLNLDSFLDNIDNLAASYWPLSSDSSDGNTEQGADPLISIIIDALHFDVTVFQLKNLSAIIDFDF